MCSRTVEPSRSDVGTRWRAVVSGELIFLGYRLAAEQADDKSDIDSDVG